MMETPPFLKQFTGRFSAIMKWEQLDALWAELRSDTENNWFLYTVGEAVPQAPADSSERDHFLTSIDETIRKHQRKDYCGFVYVDDRQSPGFIKIFNPRKLGCGGGNCGAPSLPHWIISRAKPVDINQAFNEPEKTGWLDKFFS